MEQFIYFNSRLTAKLNLIYHHPLTIVTGAPGVGKTFSVTSYLHSTKAEVVWHVSRAELYENYLMEFLKSCARWDAQFSDMKDFADLSDPAGVAVDVAVRFKRMEAGRYPRVYVLEYMDNQVPDPVLVFLHYLSCQQIKGYYLILINRASLQDKLSNYAWSGINVISEEFFLVKPDEIKTTFKRNGLAIDTDEANYLYLRSAGLISEVDRLYQAMGDKGKAALYESPDRDAFSWDGSPEWTHRFLVENDIWHLPALDAVRRSVEAMHMEEASIDVERARMRSERYSAEWDACEYYNAVLLMMSGNVKNALEALNQAFDQRVQRRLYQSAHRINLAQIQLKILLGENWFKSERELLISFANRRIYENQGISRMAAGLALWRAGESRKIIAYLDGSDEEDEIDAGYREYLLSAAYHEIGFDAQAIQHHDAARNGNIRGGVYFSTVLFNATTVSIDQKRNAGDRADRYDVSPEYRKNLNTWRKAIYKNTVKDEQKGREALTVRESEVAECVARKMSNKEIADQLFISENTVKTILKHIFAKLQISSRRELQ